MNLLDVHRVRLKVTGVISDLNSSLPSTSIVNLLQLRFEYDPKWNESVPQFPLENVTKLSKKKKQDNINAMSNVQILGVTNIILVTFVTYLALLLPKLKATLLDVTSVLLNAYSA